MLDDNAPASGAVGPRLSVIVCSPGRHAEFLQGISAPTPKSGVLSLGSSSFSILILKEKDLAEDLVVARCTTMCFPMHAVPRIVPIAKARPRVSLQNKSSLYFPAWS
jgi:hypothetical protein